MHSIKTIIHVNFFANLLMQTCSFYTIVVSNFIIIISVNIIIGGEHELAPYLDDVYGSHVCPCLRTYACVQLLCVHQGLIHDVIQMHAHA